MSIELESADFVRAMGHVGRVIERRTTIPALATTRLRQTPDGLALSATDLDLWIDATIPMQSNDADLDQLLQQPAQVAKAVKASGADRMTLANGDARIQVGAGDLSLSMPALPSEDFPVDEAATDAARWSGTLGAEAVRAIRRVSGAISTEETRYYLNGVYVEADRDWGMRAVATDGHRLYVAPFQVPDAAGDMPGIIIPRKAVRELLRLAGRDQAVTVRLAPKLRRNDDGGTQVLHDQAQADRLVMDFDGIGVRLTSKLIDGTFPDHRRVIPDGVARTMTLDRSELSRAVASVRAGAGGRVNALRFTPGDDGLCRLACRWEGIDAEAATTVPFDGDARTPFGLNGHYIAEAVGRFADSERVTMQLEDTDASLVSGPIKVVSAEDDSFLAVVMPMRI